MMPPYYESRYIRANHPDRAQAVWLRWTLLYPQPGEPVADVWVMVFDPDGGGNRALKQPHPIAAADYRTDPGRRASPTPRSTTTAAARNARRRALGPDDRAGGAGGRQAAHRPRLPGEVPDGEDHGAPSAGPVRRHGRTRRHRHAGRLDRQRQPQLGHASTPRPTPSGRCAASTRNPSSSLEIVTAHAALGPLRLPAATLFVLRHAGREIAVRSVLAARHTRGEYQPFAWSFGGRVDGVEMRGEIRAEPTDVIGLTYTDTDGGTKYCYNSALADCRISLSGNGIGHRVDGVAAGDVRDPHRRAQRQRAAAGVSTRVSPIRGSSSAPL